MERDDFPVSLVIPVYNESKTIHLLIQSINDQEKQPSDIIIVDGGSTDDTVPVIKKICGENSRFRVIEAGRAMPGKGRNIGVTNARTEWIAFTDAGIKLDKYWLSEMVKKAKEDNAPSIVYGNFSPQVNNFFEKCAAIAYVPGNIPGKIRGKSIVSCLLKKEVWKKAGGFPDWRAAEDLVFMENAERAAEQISFSPEANAYWELRPDLGSTYKKFDLYSKYNVWAGRQAYWHYGIARQYALMLIPLFLAFFYSWYWLFLLPLWLLARTTKRILIHRHEYGVKTVANPAVVFMVAIITLVIDAGTFSGWIKAVTHTNEISAAKNQPH